MQFFLGTYLADRLAGLHSNRTARAERNHLRAELESYRTPAERDELSAILSRHSAADVASLEQASGWRAA